MDQPLADRSGSEKTLERDPRTGREVWRMTNNRSHDVHSYYDACAWSPDGRHIAFTAVRPEDVILEKQAQTDKGALFVMDAVSGDMTCVVDGVAFELHTGCLPLWKDERTLVYRGLDPDGSGYTGVVDIASKAVRRIPGLSGRFLSPDGGELICQSAAKAAEEAAIVDLQTLSARPLIDGATLSEAMLDAFNREERMPDMDPAKLSEPCVANLKWSPDGEKIILRFNFLGTDQYMKSMFILNPDGSGLHRLGLVTPRFGHHSWHPDSRRIIYVDSDATGPGRRYYLVDRDGLERRVLHSQALGGHPVFNPAGTELVDFANGSIWHLDVATDTVQQLASYTNHLHKGLHAHPSWSPDGSQASDPARLKVGGVFAASSSPACGASSSSSAYSTDSSARPGKKLGSELITAMILRSCPCRQRCNTPSSMFIPATSSCGTKASSPRLSQPPSW